MMDSLTKWLNEYKTVDQIHQVLGIEQFLSSLPVEKRCPMSAATFYGGRAKKPKVKDGHSSSCRAGYVEVTVEVAADCKSYFVEAAVVKKLPTSVLLGRDVPELVWIGSSKHAAEEALAATTRAQAKRKREEEASASKKKDSGLHDKVLLRLEGPEDEGLAKHAVPEHDTNAPREEEKATTTLEDSDFGVNGKALRKLQLEDETLKGMDTSRRAIGAVLSQVGGDGEEHPTAYYSRKLLPCEEKYSTTDHRFLEWLDRLKENNSRLTSWSLALQHYQYSVQYRTGQRNRNADSLSLYIVKATNV
eukprot:Em0006g188a